jgi:predicted glutamine amidotransferase
MCRILGSVSHEPLSLRHELLEAENPFIRQSEEHDSGWGMAVYGRADGGEPDCIKFPQAAFADGDFRRATDHRGRIFNVHVRRATIGGLTPQNTHPFCLASYSFSHNGTVMRCRSLLDPGVHTPAGETDSECVFNHLMAAFDDGDPVGSLRRTMATVVERSPFSGINFLFSDGERLFAYRLGLFDLHWLARPGQIVVSSEKLTGERWHTVHQDVLLVLDPDDDLAEPHAERLLGDELVERAQIRKFEDRPELRGEARGKLAAERARLAAAAPAE